MDIEFDDLHNADIELNNLGEFEHEIEDLRLWSEYFHVSIIKIFHSTAQQI